jgi:hypothetical protein
MRSIFIFDRTFYENVVMMYNPSVQGIAMGRTFLAKWCKIKY